MDPAAWLLERQSRQLKRKLETLRAGGYGQGWFEEWYAGKKTKKLHEPTLLACLNDLVIFQQDPVALSIWQFQLWYYGSKRQLVMYTYTPCLCDRLELER